MQEENKESKTEAEKTRLKNHNITRLESLMTKEAKKPNKERRLMAKNNVIQSICQVEKGGKNSLYLTNWTDEGMIFKFDLELK